MIMIRAAHTLRYPYETWFRRLDQLISGTKASTMTPRLGLAPRLGFRTRRNENGGVSTRQVVLPGRPARYFGVLLRILQSRSDSERTIRREGFRILPACLWSGGR